MESSGLLILQPEDQPHVATSVQQIWWCVTRRAYNCCGGAPIYCWEAWDRLRKLWMTCNNPPGLTCKPQMSTGALFSLASVSASEMSLCGKESIPLSEPVRLLKPIHMHDKPRRSFCWHVSTLNALIWHLKADSEHWILPMHRAWRIIEILW